MNGKRVVGIDIGVSNTVIAWMNDAGHTEIIGDVEGNLVTPSAVFFDDHRVLIGEEARLRGMAREDSLATGFKGDLGKSTFRSPVRGRSLAPEVITSFYLSRLRAWISRRVGLDWGAVLTVPSYYGELERGALVDAAHMAGIEVLDIINEPIAAVLAFGEYGPYIPPGTTPPEKPYVLVYDLGGHSFEATLVEIQPGGFRVVAAGHDESLGGERWDDRIIDYAAEHFLRHHHKDIRDDSEMIAGLRGRVSRAKAMLGMRPSVVITVESGGQRQEVAISRETFAEITSSLLERSVQLVDKHLLKPRQINWPDLQRVILVGGGTHLRTLRRRLEQLTGKKPDHSINPEEAVSRGAAIYGQQMLLSAMSFGRTPRVTITNVTSNALGIEGVDLSTGKKVNKILIPRGTVLPAKVTKKFVTKATAQRDITIVVLEGESDDPRDCKVVGKATIRDLPKEITEEWPIDVTYEYTPSGRLKVDAHVRYTDKNVHLEVIRTTGLTPADRARWQAVITAGGGWNMILTALGVEQAMAQPMRSPGMPVQPGMPLAPMALPPGMTPPGTVVPGAMAPMAIPPMAMPPQGAPPIVAGTIGPASGATPIPFTPVPEEAPPADSLAKKYARRLFSALGFGRGAKEATEDMPLSELPPPPADKPTDDKPSGNPNPPAK